MAAIDRAKISVLIDNSPRYDTYLKGCFGLSLWLEIESEGTCKNVLFDVGPLSEPLLYNAEMMGLNVEDVDLIVLSHCHFDHTAALADVVERIGREVNILAHPEIFRSNFALKPDFMNYGMGGRNGRAELERIGGNLILTRSPLEVFPGLMYTGEAERTAAFERSGGVSTFSLDARGNVVDDEQRDDVSLVLNVEDRGIVAVTGCAPAGPISILRHSIQVSGMDRIEGVIGGFHLLEAGSERVDETIAQMKVHAPNLIAPMHCTGLIPTAKIAMAFPDAFREMHAGDVIEYG